MNTPTLIRLNFFKHYKNKPYKILGTAKHSETLENYVIYECLYQNTEAQVWIRPESMFYGAVEVENKLVSRFKSVEFSFVQHQHISPDCEAFLFPLCKEVFSNFDEKKFRKRLEQKEHVQLFALFDNNTCVAFKLGYAIDSVKYYSWLGCVAKPYRQLGLGQFLMTSQHEWAQKHKFKIIETKSENKFKEMICLNLKAGFQITGTEVASTGQLKILFQKKLSSAVATI